MLQCVQVVYNFAWRQQHQSRSCQQAAQPDAADTDSAQMPTAAPAIKSTPSKYPVAAVSHNTSHAVSALQQGKVIAPATDTVYGLATDVDSEGI